MSQSATQVQAITNSLESLRLRSPNNHSQQLPLSPLGSLDQLLEGPLLTFENAPTLYEDYFTKGDQYAKPPPHTFGAPIPLPSIAEDFPDLGELSTFEDNSTIPAMPDAAVTPHSNTAQPTSCLFAPDDYYYNNK